MALKSVYIGGDKIYIKRRCDLKKSPELIQLEICHNRGIRLNENATQRLYYLSKGFEGEDTVYQWFQKYSDGQLKIVTDYWFNHGKDMQADLIVILNNRWIIVEVKNYYGCFEYRNHECFLNGKLMSDNYFNQLVHRTKRLQHIANEFNESIKVDSVIVFIDEHCEVNIATDTSIKIVQRHQLRAYIKSLVEEQSREVKIVSKQKVIKHLDKFRVASPFQPLIIEGQKGMAEIRRGISCFNCKSLNTRMTYKNVCCQSCGKKELKHLAVTRTALEMRYIFYYDKSMITRRGIYDFCGGTISKSVITKAMSKKFCLVNKGRNSYYDIPL